MPGDIAARPKPPSDSSYVVSPARMTGSRRRRRYYESLPMNNALLGTAQTVLVTKRTLLSATVAFAHPPFNSLGTPEMQTDLKRAPS